MLDALKLTIYLGERDRAGQGLLADALIDVYERHGVKASALLRGVEGFGAGHRLHTERLLTLSEDLPVVSVAVDSRERVEGLLEEVREICRHGLISLERARLLTDPSTVVELPEDGRAVKLTVYVGRQERAMGRPAHLAVVDLLHRHGVAGATVLLGVDGTAHGVRQRGRFFARNAQVPLMIISVGAGHSIAAALPELLAILSRPLLTLEQVEVCKRDGALLASPDAVAQQDETGLAYWQKLTLFAAEQARHEGQPLHSALIGRLRREGAAGATALRGLWGYHGEHRPHGERLWSIGRHVPVVTVLLDTPANARRWFAVIDEMTAQTGLVTSEMVPAVRASGPGIACGPLTLAEPLRRRPSAE
jgi:PII-like signaling protein